MRTSVAQTGHHGRFDRVVVSLICQTLVDPADPAFAHPTKFVGPEYTKVEGRRMTQLRGWDIRPDGKTWRRVVPSPEPLTPIEMPTIRMLVGNGAIVICSGGGGIPVRRGVDGLLHGVEAVIDKDLTALLLARELGADALLLLTDVANVETDFATDRARPIFHTTPEALRAEPFPRARWDPKSMPPADSSRPPATGPSSVDWTTPSACSPGRREPSSNPPMTQPRSPP
jgi:carbamate kinase